MQQAVLSQLKSGDRFYFPKNKKEICEFAKKERKTLRDGYEYFWTKKDREHSSKKDLLIIFLRNIND